ncbi:MAG TPA: extracellular solute-binding protein [Candidatus Treponema faecavium]|nr:extracellular solute-binding protein [Candidatus Treponema faecavium]
MKQQLLHTRRKFFLRGAVGAVFSVFLLASCGGAQPRDGKIHIELLNYKPEAVKIFETLEQKFNESQDEIVLTIESPNEAMTILKTRFVREDPPDIIGIGGDINYSIFLDAGMLMDISDYAGLADIKDSYLETADLLEFVPAEGAYAAPFAANAAGVLYNKDIFDEHGWTIPRTWDEFIALCGQIQAAGIQPLFFGYRDTWTCLAPWNAIAVDLVPADICQQVNRGEATFTEAYRKVAERDLALLDYAQPDPFAYGYNDACTEFARGGAAMFVIGNYAIPQILSVNPDINIDSFVFPASNDPEQNVLNSGNDLQFSIIKDCEHKEAAYKVLDFLFADENVQLYLDDQNAVPCKKGNFTISHMLNGMKPYIDSGKTADYQDHYYPAGMGVDAMIQSFLINKDTDAFLTKFDTDWVRYNRDIIRKLKDYQARGGNS